MELNANQTNVLLPQINGSSKKQTRRKSKKSGQVYYKEDIAGLLVFAINDEGNQQLLTPYAITDYGYKTAIKQFIDSNYDKRKK